MITILIQAYNEEDNIVECIKSARLLSSSILVIDTESTDNTARLADQAGADVLEFPYHRYVEPSRQFGIEQVKNEWIFILDADERITKELAAEIKDTISSSEFTYYKVSRKEYFARKWWLQHGGWWPNFQIRLIKKSAFKEWPSRIHATPEIKGSMGYLKNSIIHYSKNDYGIIVNKTIVFEDVESDLLFEANRPVSTTIFIRKFAGELFRRLFKWKGFLDGDIGIIESVYQAFSKTITYLYLYEKKKNRTV
jgi:glycosyltransferase involved in cell wall biosynthesis